MNPYEILRIRAALLSVLAVLLFGAGVAQAQIVNESFEENGQFSLTGWQVTDASCQEAFGETPAGGGAWSLKLHRRNLQGGCFGVVYQVIPEAQSGEVWRVRASIRLPEGRGGIARLYWTNFATADSSGVLPYLPAPSSVIATTSSAQWTTLALIHTLDVAPGDSIGIVLDAGVTSGPTANIDFAYFDLISIDQPSQQELATARGEQPEAPAFAFAHNFPNPFRTTTTISFTLNRSDFVTLEIYDLLGRKISTLIADQLPVGTHTTVWETHDLPDGLYVGRLQAGAQSRTLKLVRLR